MADDLGFDFDWMRTLSTQQLREYSAALEIDLDVARQKPRGQGKHTVAFCTSRLAAIRTVLQERGVS